MALLDMNEYDKVIKVCRQIAIDKNLDYGSDNLTAFGQKGIVIRMYDKMQRLKNLLFDKGEETLDVNDEAIEDTLRDLLNYAAFAVMIKDDNLVKKGE